MSSSVNEAGELHSSIYNRQSRVYSDLHPGEIRLVTLFRGKWTDTIHCQLRHAPLGNQSTYKALSYAWGSPRATRPILVNGCQHSVTVNLESALRRIRESESDLTLWIDALCINQSNNSERTAQVRLMHDIFASTEEVIVYLGEPPRHSFTALKEVTEPPSTSTTAFHCDDRDEDKLEIFRNRCAPKKSSEVLKNEAGIDYAFDVFCFLRLLAGKQDLYPLPAFDPNSRQFIDTEYQRNLFEGLRQLLLRPWWNRIWVIQEVVVPKTVTMVYGSTVSSWDMFVNAARWDSHNSSSLAPLSFPHEHSTVLAWFSRVILDIERNRALWREGKQSSLLPLLRRFSGRKASDDRDKVFALLSLARNQTSIVPNYSLDVPAVFQNTVLDIIKITGSLAVLAGDLGRKDRQDLPSWVPDWSAAYNDLDRRRANNTENYNATSGSEASLQNHGDGVIGLAGFQVDEIICTGEVAFSDEVLLSVIYSWALLVESHFRNTTYVLSTAGLGDAFRRTLCADITSTGSDTKGFTTRPINNDDHGLITTWLRQGLESEYFPVFWSPEMRRKTWETLSNDVGDPTSYMEPKVVSPSIDAAICSATIRQTFFITGKGYIGLGPVKTRRGDHLCILKGGQTTFILRQSGYRKLSARRLERDVEIKRNCFEVIGDCYTHGLMDGEAMQEWGKVTDNTKQEIQELSKRHLEAVQKRDRCKSELFGLARETDEAILLAIVGDHAKKKLRLRIMLEDLLLRYFLDYNSEAKEQANSLVSDLSQWTVAILPWKYSWKNPEYLAGLMEATSLKIRQLAEDILNTEREIDKLSAQINEQEEIEEFIYLV